MINNTIIRENIDKYGVHLFGVFGNDEDPAFTYTVGHAERGLPELLIVGTYDMADVMNAMSEVLRDRGKSFEDGEYVNIGGRFPLKVIRADPAVKEMFTFQAGQFFESEDYEVMQVLLCDKKGRFPDEPGCEEPYASQQVYSVERRLHS